MAAAARNLPDRLLRHAEALERSGRSPLSARLMRGAAADPLTEELFRGIDLPPGSVPSLRLLAALHLLVLSGRAPGLAVFYPNAGGHAPPDGVWPVAREVLGTHADWVRERLHLTVQTNEPGRSCVLMAGLLWLADRFGRPVRLLEIGASAGLNLHPERYGYRVRGEWLGDPHSPVRFDEPWSGSAPFDVAAAAARLEIAERVGCDLAPLDPADRDDRLTLLSYIWPDELDRLRRLEAALDLAGTSVEAGDAATWLAEQPPAEALTVVWHSVMRQYLTRERWAAVEAARPPSADVVWLGMEPGTDHVRGMRLTARLGGVPDPVLLATCGDHGPPVEWT